MTLYEVLDVPEDATDDQIKASYHNLLKVFHPDSYKGDKEYAQKKTDQIIKAYKTLIDPEKRAEYDELLAAEYYCDKDSNSVMNVKKGAKTGFAEKIKDLFANLSSGIAGLNKKTKIIIVSCLVLLCAGTALLLATSPSNDESFNISESDFESERSDINHSSPVNDMRNAGMKNDHRQLRAERK